MRCRKGKFLLRFYGSLLTAQLGMKSLALIKDLNQCSLNGKKVLTKEIVISYFLLESCVVF